MNQKTIYFWLAIALGALVSCSTVEDGLTQDDSELVSIVLDTETSLQFTKASDGNPWEGGTFGLLASDELKEVLICAVEPATEYNFILLRAEDLDIENGVATGGKFSLKQDKEYIAYSNLFTFNGREDIPHMMVLYTSGFNELSFGISEPVAPEDGVLHLSFRPAVAMLVFHIHYESCCQRAIDIQLRKRHPEGGYIDCYASYPEQVYHLLRNDESPYRGDLYPMGQLYNSQTENMWANGSDELLVIAMVDGRSDLDGMLDFQLHTRLYDDPNFFGYYEETPIPISDFQAGKVYEFDIYSAY